jgi:hypothetical protein
VILSSIGFTDSDIAKLLDLHPNTVRNRRLRFNAEGLEGLLDAPRSGRPKVHDHKKIRNDILKILKERSPHNHSRWFGTTLAEELGVSEDIIGRVMRENCIRIKSKKTWCVSKDPLFDQKSAECIDVYLGSELNVYRICLDEKTSIQGTEKDTGYVMNSNGYLVRAEESRYYRHGVLNMFTGLDIKAGIAYSKFYDRKRRVEFLDFLDFLVERLPGVSNPNSGIKLHIVMDNLSSHKGCDEWLAAHPNVFFHFIPTNASWHNLVEVYFGKLQRYVLKDGSFTSLGDLSEAIVGFEKDHNKNSKEYK